jgi:hypothetical protein
MQNGSPRRAENILGLAPVTHPRRPTDARMAFVHLGPHLRVIGPIARHLHAARLGVTERARDISCGHWMQLHLIAGQADAVVDEVAAFDCAWGRVGVENICWPFFDCRLRKQSREPVCVARDHAHAGDGLAQLG